MERPGTSETMVAAERARDPILDPMDRIMELLFGLLMALSFAGAVSVAESGRADLHEMSAAALGCNLAWGLVDAIMYLIRIFVDRGRLLTLVRSVRDAADPEAGRALIVSAMSPLAVGLVSMSEVEAVRGRILALAEIPPRARLSTSDLLAAVAIFFLVVLSTFPVVLPFLLMHDVGAAKSLSRAIALLMLFLGGFALGRYAGYGAWRAAFAMTALGSLLVAAILALGG